MDSAPGNPTAVTATAVSSVPRRRGRVSDIAGKDAKMMWWEKSNRRMGFVVRLESSDEEVFLSQFQLKKLYGPHRLRWMLTRPGQVLDFAIAERWGFLEAQLNRSIEKVMRREAGLPEIPKGYTGAYSLERVVLGDGKERAGKLWEDGVYYGCQTRDGGPETFYGILFYSLKIRCMAIPQEEGPLECQDQHTFQGELADTFVFGKRQTEDEALSALDQWCLVNKGIPFTIGGPGARGRSTFAKRFYVGKRALMVKSHCGECLHASIINGIGLVGGEVDFRHAWRKSRAVWLRNLKEASQWILKVSPQFSLRRIRGPRGKTLQVDFEWLLTQSNGVFLVRIWANPDVDHFVVVDCNAMLIIDSCEREPLSLCREALKACCGDHAKVVKLPEVRRVFKSDPGAVAIRKTNKGARNL